MRSQNNPNGVRAKKLRQLRKALIRFHVGGASWSEIGGTVGETKGWIWLVAHGEIPISEERAERILSKLPKFLFWVDGAMLDLFVLDLLKQRGRFPVSSLGIPVGGSCTITGRELGRLCGTTDRNIRRVIQRLRAKGFRIEASMVPPRGYRLNDSL